MVRCKLAIVALVLPREGVEWREEWNGMEWEVEAMTRAEGLGCVWSILSIEYFNRSTVLDCVDE